MLVFNFISFSQIPQLVKNINPTTVDELSHSYPGQGKVFNGSLYFAAENSNGRELWKTNGTAAGTVQVKDLKSIVPYYNSDPQFLSIIGTDLYFFTSDGTFYKLEGATNKITFLAMMTLPTEVVVMNGRIYMDCDQNNYQGVELVQYDPISNFTTIDIFPGPDSSQPKNLTARGHSLFFSANDGTNGRELWMYDDLTMNASMVKNINAGADSSNPSDMIAFNGKVYFSADDGSNGNELWVSDGTDPGTFMVEDIYSGLNGSNPNHKSIYNNKIYFSADNGTDGVELWSSDGSSADMLANINGSGDSFAGKYGFIAASGLLFFAADNGSDGVELWKTDGTNPGTVEVSDINSSFVNEGSEPQNMFNLNSTVLFAADDGNGFEIWKTNGVSTSMLKNIQPDFSDKPVLFAIYNNKAYFYADNGTTGAELWNTDGTTVNTLLLKDINYGAVVSSNPQGFERFNNAIYFAATTGNYSWGLHKTNGTTGGTVEIKPGGGVDGFSIAGQLVKAGSYLYLNAQTLADGHELWRSDGTLGGTVEVKDINPGSTASFPNNMIEFGTKLAFAADDGVTGRELWISNGTTAGTQLLKDLYSGSNSSGVSNLTVVNNKLFFTADDGVNGIELWVSDGTTSGTVLLKNINAGSASSQPRSLKAIGNLLYFSADDGVNGRELWTSDGTTGGTNMLKDIYPGSNPSNPDWFAQLGSWVYFVAMSSPSTGPVIWRTDGTTGGTSEFFNVLAPYELTRVSNRIVFVALGNSTNGFHLWSTDGTTTSEIEDFLPGEMDYLILTDYPVYQGRWYLWLDDFQTGQELWVTDGTSLGTVNYDIAPGPPSSYPRATVGFTPFVFSADGGTNAGNELWSIQLSPLPVAGLDFNARKQNNTALLSWRTLNEINNRGFEIQRSNNGIRFDSIGFVLSRSISGNGTSYQFTDDRPLNGKNYYRLKQIDFDGSVKYSEIRWVDFDAGIPVKIYPNPATDVLNVYIGYNLDNAEMFIYSVSGQLIKKQSISGNGTIAIPIKELSKGVYSVEIKDPLHSVKMVFVKR